MLATVNPTVPLPVPGVPELTVMKGELLTAVQPQFPGAVTMATPGLPEAEKFWFGLRLKVPMFTVHGGEISLPQAFEMTTS